MSEREKNPCNDRTSLICVVKTKNRTRESIVTIYFEKIKRKVFPFFFNSFCVRISHIYHCIHRSIYDSVKNKEKVDDGLSVHAIPCIVMAKLANSTHRERIQSVLVYPSFFLRFFFSSSLLLPLLLARISFLSLSP